VSAFALQVQRVGRIRELGHQRPRLDVGLGDETRLRHHGVQRVDVQPRDVVRDQQGAAVVDAPFDLHRDAHQAQHLRRPPADARVALRRVERTEAQQHDGQAMQAMNHAAQQAPRRAQADDHSALASYATWPATSVHCTRPGNS
jgi:hypothetical protein